MNKTNTTPQIRTTRKQLTSLRALRAFEAVACHLSFTRAAEEMAVSQGAISHQIKLLEQRLGKPLFLRSGKGVALTIEGELLRDVCARSFDEIGETFRWSPAAVAMHHAYRHGLLEHTVRMARAAQALLPLYPEVDADLALAGSPKKLPAHQIRLNAGTARRSFPSARRSPARSRIPPAPSGRRR